MKEFYPGIKLSEKDLRQEYMLELKGYRKLDKNVRLYEKAYHNLFGTSLRTMTSTQLNDLIIFITNTRLSYESVEKRMYNNMRSF